MTPISSNSDAGQRLFLTFWNQPFTGDRGDEPGVTWGIGYGCECVPHMRGLAPSIFSVAESSFRLRRGQELLSYRRVSRHIDEHANIVLREAAHRRSIMKLAKSHLGALEAESRVRSFFETDPHGAIAVYLFGSFARGTEGPESDVDVAVLYSDPPARTFDGLPLALEESLEKRLGRAVEVVVLNHASADLIHRVLRDGKLLIDLDSSSRIQFEVRARNEYFDLQPILRCYRKTKT